MKRLGVASVTVVVIAAMAWWILQRPAPDRIGEAQPTIAARESAAPRSRISTDAPSEGYVTPGPTAESKANDRDALLAVASRFSVEVRDMTGRPVRDAELSLAPLEVADVRAWSPALDGAAIAAATVSTTSDENGTATFEVHGALSVARGKLALWTTAPGYDAAVRVLDSVEDLRNAEPVVVQQRLRTVISLVASDDAELEELELEVLGLVEVHLAAALSDDELAARRLFRRVLSIPGRARESFSTSFPVQAEAHARGWRSEPRAGRLEGRVALSLYPTFTLVGRYAFEGQSASGAVKVGPVNPDVVRWVRTLPLRADGTFGPSECPLAPGATYAYLLQPEDSRAQVLHRDAPARAETVRVEFAPAAGLECVAIVQDVEGEPVAGVAVTSYWDGGVNAFEEHSPPTMTDALGIATVRTVQTGNVWFRAEKPGFALTRVGPVLLSEGSARRVDIVLQPGGSLTGRVTSHQRPVEDFELTYWPGSDPDQMRIAEFSGRTDGSFAIEGVFATTQNVFARSAELPRSEIFSVPFVDGVAGPIELELPDALSARGRVIDAETRAPIEGAHVSVWAAWQAMIISQQGEDAATDSNGEFELRGLRAGENPIWVRADGYHWAQPHVDARPGAPNDLGAIPLQRGFPVDFVLTAERPHDWTKFALETRFQVLTPSAPFDASGIRRIEDCTRAPILFVVTYPDETAATLRVNVTGPEFTRFEHRVPDETTLLLSATDGPDCAVPAVLDGWLSYAQVDGTIVERSFPVRDGRATVANLPRGPAVLTLYGPVGRPLRKRIVLGPDRETRIESALTCRERTLRFLEADGTPRSTVSVAISCLDADPHAMEWFTTDNEGRVTISDPGCARVVAAVLGAHWKLGIPITLIDRDEQVVDLGDDATLAIRLVDGSAPLAARVVGAEEPTTSIVLVDTYTNADGVARWEGLFATEYGVRISGQGLWATSALVRSRAPGAPPDELQVRRVGSLQFVARGSSGEPLAGADVELVSQEFASSLAQWIAEGRLPPDSPHATDTQGSLLVKGIPHGPYAWRITLTDGRARSGSVEVAASTVTTVDVPFAE